MPLSSLKEILDPAFEERYGVAAFNIVDDLTLDAVLAAATELEAPLIVQTSLKTVKPFGADVLYEMFRHGRRDGRCRWRCTSTIAPSASGSPPACAPAGTRCCSTARTSTSRRTRARPPRSSRRRAATARTSRARSRPSPASRTTSAPTRRAHPARRGLGRLHRGHRGLRRSRPAIGTAHGLYRREPHSRPSGSPSSSSCDPIPMVLHGGTGLTPEQFKDLIARGCAKVNISTALKIAFVDAHRTYLDENPGKHDPPSLLRHVSTRP